MNMRKETAKYYINYLLNHNYKINNNYAYSFFNGILDGIDFVSPTNKIVTFRIQPNKVYLDEIINMPDETEIEEFDYNRMEIAGIFFESSFCNRQDFVHGDRNGIFLVGESGWHCVPDMIDPEYAYSYYRHNLNDFEKCVWIQNHPIEQEKIILKKHLEHLDYIESITGFLNSVDFYQDYSSLFDCSRDGAEFKDTSNPFVMFKTKVPGCHIRNTITFETDCINGELLVNFEQFDDDIKNWFYKKFIIDKKFNKVALQYLYLVDKDYYIDSYVEIMDAIASLDSINKGFDEPDVLQRIKLDKIPDKEWVKEEVIKYLSKV